MTDAPPLVLEGEHTRILFDDRGNRIGRYTIDDKLRNEWPVQGNSPNYLAIVFDKSDNEVAQIKVEKRLTTIELSERQVAGYEDRHPEGSAQMVYTGQPIPVKPKSEEDPRKNNQLYTYAKIIAENPGQSIRELRHNIRETTEHYDGVAMVK